jgi:hypothetical protein
MLLLSLVPPVREASNCSPASTACSSLHPNFTGNLRSSLTNVGGSTHLSGPRKLSELMMDREGSLVNLVELNDRCCDVCVSHTRASNQQTFASHATHVTHATNQDTINSMPCDL